MRMLTKACIRDGNVAAPLKHLPQSVAAAGVARIRDGNVAAPLKLEFRQR